MTAEGTPSPDRDALTAMPVALIELDGAGVVRSAAGGGLRVPPGGLVGRSIWDLIEDPEGAARVRSALTGAEVAGAGRWHGRLWHASYRPVLTDGQPTGTAGVFVDITELSTSAGRPGQVPFELVLQLVEAVLVLGPDGRVSWANEGCSRLLGRPVPGGTEVGELLPEAAPLLRVQPPGSTEQHEVRLPSADGPNGWVRLRASAVHAESGGRLATVVVLTDITAAREQERRLEAAERTAEQLQLALDTRVLIEQAKGILAARRGVGVDAAFDVLRKHARDNNLRLQDVARGVVEQRLLL